MVGMRTAIAAVGIAIVLAWPLAAAAAVPEPIIEGPITSPGGAFVAGTSFDPAEVGYVQEEFFISGTATAYTSAEPLTGDGRWTALPADTAAYKTRLIVYRPAKARDFKGTVVVEWLNVSGGLDSAPDWITAHTAMIRAGMAWVGVSAQYVGVEGGTGGLVSIPLKSFPRYASLVHPGDSFSYDMFSQAGQAVEGESGRLLLGGAVAKRVIAVGESQSAFRLTTYVDAVHPVAGVYDGYLIHSRGGFGAALSEAPEPVIPAPDPTLIRTDLDVPVFTVQTETDLFTLGSYGSRQPDTDLLRLWEIAGTAHADVYTLVAGMADVGDDPSVATVVENASPLPGIIDCDGPVNSGPQHWVVNAAVAGLERWVRTGRPPRSQPRLETTSSATPAFVLDAHGNVEGGVRTPWVDVPVATLSGGSNSGGGFCFIFGTTMLFDEATLADLYPTHKAYVQAYRKATNRAARRGVILRPDARLIIRNAELSDIGGASTPTPPHGPNGGVSPPHGPNGGTSLPQPPHRPTSSRPRRPGKVARSVPVPGS